MEPIERYAVSEDWMTLVLVAAFLLVVLAKLFLPERFEHFTKIMYSNRYFNLNQKSPASTDTFSIMLCAMNFLSVSLLLYISLETFSWMNGTRPKTVFVQILLGYSLFFMIKYLLEKITAAVFSIENIVEPYLFHKISHWNLVALFLLPVNILLIYGFQASRTIMMVILATTALIGMAILVDFYIKKRNVLMPHLFYFILYLCAFEIAPYFILYKVIRIT